MFERKPWWNVAETSLFNGQDLHIEPHQPANKIRGHLARIEIVTQEEPNLDVIDPARSPFRFDPAQMVATGFAGIRSTVQPGDRRSEAKLRYPGESKEEKDCSAIDLEPAETVLGMPIEAKQMNEARRIHEVMEGSCCNVKCDPTSQSMRER